MFTLHSQLQADTVVVGQFELCLVLLHKDSHYPWCILVPQRPQVEEIFHLDSADRLRLMDESCHLAEVMHDCFAPNKMNIAALGNQVPQLHVHHIARFREDAAWPNPIWGAVPPKPYSEAALRERVERLRFALQGEGFSVNS